MASRYEISTIFKMIDNFSGPMKSIAGSSSVMAKKVSADMRKTEMQIQAAGQAMKTMAGLAAGAAVALAGKTVVDSVKTYIEFEDAVTKAGSKFKDLDVTSADYQQNLESLQTAAREVGAATMFSATDAAGALEKMAQAGIDSKTSMSILMGTTNLAVAAGTDLTTAVDIATDAMGMFNKSLTNRGITDAADQLNLISDVMAKTGVLANTDLQGLFEGMTYAGPSLSAAGQSIETISASLGMLANVGIKGSAAGTALNAVFTQLSAPDKVKKLEELGVKVKDAQGNFLSFTSILGDLEKVTKTMGSAEKSSLLNSIFLVQGGKAVNALLDQGTNSLKEYIKELENSGGTAEAIAGAQMKSFNGMIEQLKSAWQDKQLSLGKAFEVGGAKDALANLITYVQNFDVAPIAAALTQIMQAIPGIVEGFVGFVQTLWNMRDVIGALVIAWGVYKAAIIGALVVEKMMAFFSAIKAVQTATKGMSAAQAALNVVMNANPIGLIIIAVAALGLGIYELIKHWDSVSAAMSIAWEWIKNIASIIWENLLLAFDKVKEFFLEFQPLVTMLLGPVGDLVNMFVEIARNFDNIKQAFSDGGFIAGIKTIGETIISAVLAPIQKVFELLSKIPIVGSYFDGKAAELADFRADALSGFGSVSNQSATAPVTQGERTAYSVTENNNNTSTEVTVTLDKGLKGSVSGNAPNVTVLSVSSAAWK